jgi:predicted nucleotidyltransferase
VFGSYVRGEQKKRSDLDVLVEFADDSLSLLGYIHLQNHLSDLLGVQVDLVERAMVKPALSDRIMRETVSI